MNSFGWDPQAQLISSLAPGWFPGDGLVSGRSITAHLGDVQFHSLPQWPTHSQPFTFWFHTLDGWWESAPDATSSLVHPTGDGSILINPRFSARVIDLRGHIITNDSAFELSNAQAVLSKIRSEEFRVTELVSGLSTVADVWKREVRFTRLSSGFARFSMILRADDPLRYSGGQPLRNGSNALVNRGDVDAFPVVDLVGPHGALTITHPGGSFSFPALSSGSRSIDCRNGDVWNGNTRVFVGSGAWPVVRSGGSSWSVSGLGSGGATVRRFEAWS